MTGDPNRPLQVALEEEIGKLAGVRAVRASATAGGRVSEVHVVADPGKPAKQVVRDIQTLAMASLGIEIDYRTVSVVQLGDRRMELSGARAVLSGLSWSVTGLHASCTVELTEGDRTARASYEGSVSEASRPRIAATATLQAVSGLRRDGKLLDLLDVTLLRQSSGQRIAVAVVELVGSLAHRELLVGAALVRADEVDAWVRCVLDAVNRRVLSGDHRRVGVGPASEDQAAAD